MKPRVGVSRCLVGDEVRYNGGHKHERYLTETLAEYFELVPVCPEVEVGMGTPRETVRLEGDLDDPRMVAPKSGKDWTEEMRRYSERRLRKRDMRDIHGFIFEKNSPSCGLIRVKVHTPQGMPERKGRGMFSAAFVKRFPHVPVEDQGRLNDPGLRENFIARVFCRFRWTEFLGRKPRQRDLVEYHTANKLILMSHDPAGLTALGRIVADSGRSLEERLNDYEELQTKVLEKIATRRRQVNVLQHARGYLRKALDDGDREELSNVIEEYRLGRIPLIVPVTLLKHHFRRNPHPWMSVQTYFNPYPSELMLRNHV